MSFTNKEKGKINAEIGSRIIRLKEILKKHDMIVEEHERYMKRSAVEMEDIRKAINMLERLQRHVMEME